MRHNPAAYERTVQALCGTIAYERYPADTASAPEACSSVAAFLLRCQRGMPDYLRMPLRILTLAFAFAPVARLKRPFYRLSPAERSLQVRRWRNSRLGFRRDLIKFYETLAVFGLYAELCPEDYRTVGEEGSDG